MKLRKYNPALLSDEELIEQFVARKNDLKILIDMIRSNIDSSANQHIMFIGSRGMGKTTIIMRAMAEVNRDKDLSEAWYPIVMAEESYMVGSAADFWLEAILRLAESLNDTSLKQTHELLLEENDEKTLYEKALGVLLGFVDEQNKRLLIAVENLNMLFDEQLSDSDGWQLRETLINEPRVMMVATATSRFDMIDNIKLPMFELFAIRELKPLDLSDCRKIWEMSTEQEATDIRMRPIEILTGGNPRLLTILAAFTAKSSFSALVEDLISLIDDHTDYLKSNTESLPPLERKVFVALADFWDPASARDISRITRMDLNKASMHLSRLVKKGAVMVQRQEGKRRYYQLVERLYNIYHQMRRRGGGQARVNTVVKFMVDYYEKKELCQIINNISKESLGLAPEERNDHLLAVQKLVEEYKEPDERVQMIQSIDSRIFDCPDSPSALKQLQQEIILGNIGTVDDIDSENEGEIIIEFLISECRSELTAFEDVLSNIQIIEENEDSFFSRLANAYFGSDTKDTSLSINTKISNTKELSVLAFSFLGSKLLGKKLLNESKIAFNRALELDEKSVFSLVGLGNVHTLQKEFKESEKTFRRAIEIDKKFAFAWLGLAGSLYGQERYEETEQVYHHIIGLDDQLSLAWDGLGESLCSQEKYKDAENAFRNAIDFDENDAHIWISLGNTLRHQKRYDEAEKAVQHAIKLNKDSASAWIEQGKLMELQKRYDEAERAFRHATSLDENDMSALVSLGNFLEGQKHDLESKQVYYKALELDSDKKNNLAEKAYYQLLQGKFEEALDIYAIQSKMLNKISELGVAWVYNLFFLGKFKEAKTIANDLVEKNPNKAEYISNLGYILLSQKDYENAANCFNNAVKLDNKSPLIHANLGIALGCNDKKEEAQKSFSTAIDLLNEENIESAAMNSLARLCLVLRYSDKYSQAEKWIETARKNLPAISEYVFTHALILAAQSRWSEALKPMKSFLENRTFAANFTPEVIDFFIHEAAEGNANESLEILKKSPSAEHLEPLIVGLQKYVGEKPNAPQEIDEVAKDIAAEIEDVKNKKTSGQTKASK